MKKITALALFLALLLVGCGTPQTPEKGESTSQTPAETAVAAKGTGPDLHFVPDSMICDSDGAALLTIRKALGENGAFESILACVTDWQTGVSSPLCQKQGCGHKDDTCPAWKSYEQMGGSENLAVTQNYYVFITMQENVLEAAFFPKQGGDPLQVTWEGQKNIRHGGLIYPQIVVDGDTVYFRLSLVDPQEQARQDAAGEVVLPERAQQEDVGYAASPEGIELVQLLEKAEWLAGTRGRNLLLLSTEEPVMQAETDEARLAQEQNRKTKLYERDLNTGEMRLLQEMTGQISIIAGQTALYWACWNEECVFALDYDTGEKTAFPPGLKLFFTSPFLDADGKFLLMDAQGDSFAVDRKTGETQPFVRQKKSFNEMGFAKGKMLIWDSETERWGLWPMEDYRQNQGEPAWFDFSGCDAYLAG